MDWNNLDLKQYEEELKNRDAEWARKNARILNAIEKQLGKEYRQAVFDCIMESEGYGLFELVKKPTWKKQTEDWGAFDHIYVDQWMNGGMTGDDFAGDIYIPLKENLYLKVRYEM